MVSFRRWFVALAVLALFAGLASAQVQTQTSPLNCNSNVSVTPTLRSEGITELVGDILITCTGGSGLAQGSVIPQANITIALGQTITSRLFSSNGTSEALLLIDEPQSGLPGYGPGLAQSVCATPLTGCVQWVGNQAGATQGTAVSSCATTTTANNFCSTTGTTPGANVFQGVVAGNQVTFFGIPILAPVTTGNARVFRITNIRINASAAGGGSTSGAQQIVASILTSGATPLPITQPTPIVGFVQQGLTASVSGIVNQTQCVSITNAGVALLSFTEGFGSSFKTRVAAQSNTAYAGQVTNPTNQNVPGTIYNSESGLIIASGSNWPGQADFGTRLKAVFNNVPDGVRLFVSTQNVNNLVTTFTPSFSLGAAGNNIIQSGNTGYTGVAQLITSETAAVSSTTGFPSVTLPSSPSTVGNVTIFEVPIDATTKSGTAVWEVLNTNPATIETLRFGLYATYVSDVANGKPAPGKATVTMSFAPTSTVTSASTSAPIPRFVPGAQGPYDLFTITICRTILLYPFVTATAGFDTGVAISNTSDSTNTGITTPKQAGTCTLNLYQANGANPPQFTTPTIPSGSTWSSLVSAIPGASTFGSASATNSSAGYMIAVCNFQYAHGYAFVSDVGIRNFATSYLALVIPDPGTSNRPANPVSLATANTGENIAH